MNQIFRPMPKSMRPAPMRHCQPSVGLHRRWLPDEQEPHHAEAGQQQEGQAQPFVLRAAVGEVITTEIFNLLTDTPLCLAVVDDDYGILEDEGVEIAPGESRTLTWHCRQVGIYPIYNRACRDAAERRILLGVLIIDAV